LNSERGSDETPHSICVCATLGKSVCGCQNRSEQSSTSTQSSSLSRTTQNDTKTEDKSDDYCMLSVNATAPKYPNTAIRTLSTTSTTADDTTAELNKFALHLVRSSSSKSESVTTKTKGRVSSTSNDYAECSHTHEKKKTLHCVSDQHIDVCTCMVCVKGSMYHMCEDKDTMAPENFEPCTCVGRNKGSVVRRWMCLGTLALFLPCLFCYIPAKLCQRMCTRRGHDGAATPDTPLKDNTKLNTVVKYVGASERNRGVNSSSVML